MNIVDIINKKKNKGILSKEELEYAFNGYIKDEVKDYQMSSLLMTICINGMNDEEVLELTDIFIKSGDILDLNELGTTVEKHSTGGVGDKTTLIIAPIVSACGVIVPKMSGRGLGHTGGTTDKLESIPGFKISLSNEEFIRELKAVGMSVIGQTLNLAPMDKKIYALRDVTGTVESLPLVAISVMSKKIASGATKILIDIKTGKGAIARTMSDAEELKRLMIAIGKKYNREVRCLITNMDNPLGRNVGNSLEVIESMDLLLGKVKGTLLEVCLEISSNMISMGKGISVEEALKEAQEVVEKGKAYNKFCEFVKYQDGDINNMKVSDNIVEIKSTKEGTIRAINALKVGELSVSLGAGRKTKEDTIDHSVGIVLEKIVGDVVNIGDTLLKLYVKDGFNENININEIYEIN